MIEPKPGSWADRITPGDKAERVKGPHNFAKDDEMSDTPDNFFVELDRKTQAQNNRIAEIETKLANSDGIVIDYRALSLKPILSRIADLEAALAKQRAVNEALLTWWFGDRTKNPEATEQLHAALREALKQ